MDLEEETTKKSNPPYSIGQPLSEMSIEEIDETIESLNQEIQRLTEAKNDKVGHLSAAEALFKTT